MKMKISKMLVLVYLICAIQLVKAGKSTNPLSSYTVAKSQQQLSGKNKEGPSGSTKGKDKGDGSNVVNVTIHLKKSGKDAKNTTNKKTLTEKEVGEKKEGASPGRSTSLFGSENKDKKANEILAYTFEFEYRLLRAKEIIDTMMQDKDIKIIVSSSHSPDTLLSKKVKLKLWLTINTAQAQVIKNIESAQQYISPLLGLLELYLKTTEKELETFVQKKIGGWFSRWWNKWKIQKITDKQATEITEKIKKFFEDHDVYTSNEFEPTEKWIQWFKLDKKNSAPEKRPFGEIQEAIKTMCKEMATFSKDNIFKDPVLLIAGYIFCLYEARAILSEEFAVDIYSQIGLANGYIQKAKQLKLKAVKENIILSSLEENIEIVNSYIDEEFEQKIYPRVGRKMDTGTKVYRGLSRYNERFENPENEAEQTIKKNKAEWAAKKIEAERAVEKNKAERTIELEGF